MFLLFFWFTPHSYFTASLAVWLLSNSLVIIIALFGHIIGDIVAIFVN